MAQLVPARLAREHAAEVPREIERRLAVAGRGVERNGGAGRTAGQEGGEFGWIARPVALVLGRVAGEVVLDAHAAMLARRQSDTALCQGGQFS